MYSCMLKALVALVSGIWGQVFHRNETLMTAASVHYPTQTFATGSGRCKKGSSKGHGRLGSLCFEECTKWHSQSSVYRKGNSLCDLLKVEGGVVGRLGLEPRAPARSEL